MTTHHDQYGKAAKAIIDRVGKNIVMGVPLGIGKPIGVLNAFFRLASQDSSLRLTIITGLTLARPKFHNELQKRLADPILDRLLHDYENPLYEEAREKKQLPDNVKVIEFFLAPGKYLHNPNVQQDYISSSYTNVVRDALHYNMNVLAQQVSPSKQNPNEYSLSSNSDLFKDVARYLERDRMNGKAIAIVAEINSNAPFMSGDALINADVFTDIVDTHQYRALFAIPREELSPQDHLIGLYASCLIKDDSCLQIGIGKLSMAIASSLIMRNENNALYQSLLRELNVDEKFGETMASDGSLATFDKGLYASTEMMSDEYIQLLNTGILKKRVYDHVGLQTLLNENKINETVTPALIEILLNEKIIHSTLTLADMQFLQAFGIFKSNIGFQSGHLILPDGEVIEADLTKSDIRQKINAMCLGNVLQSGKIVHAGFFIGSNAFYQALRDLSPEMLQQIDMTSITRTNTLSWSPELAKLQRKNARLINSAMMMTLGGVAISDGLKNLQEVSGVGGQFDFVNMAQMLEGARSIITCRSTRESKEGMQSNILWNYPNYTIPRYLRDIIVTEYGIADCRSKTDANVIKAILNITDSRYQSSLLKKAKRFGKVEEHYDIPKPYQNNHPKRIISIIKEFQLKGYCKPYPFGSDLTEEEQILEKALLYLKKCSKIKLVSLIITSCFYSRDKKWEPYLMRMNLQKPTHFKEWVYQKLVISAIRKTHSD